MKARSIKIFRFILIGVLSKFSLVANSQSVTHYEFCERYKVPVAESYEAVRGASIQIPAKRDDASAKRFWGLHATAEKCDYVAVLATYILQMGYERPAYVEPIVLDDVVYLPKKIQKDTKVSDDNPRPGRAGGYGAESDPGYGRGSGKTLGPAAGKP